MRLRGKKISFFGGGGGGLEVGRIELDGKMEGVGCEV